MEKFCLGKRDHCLRGKIQKLAALSLASANKLSEGFVVLQLAVTPYGLGSISINTTSHSVSSQMYFRISTRSRSGDGTTMHLEGDWGSLHCRANPASIQTTMDGLRTGLLQ